MPSRYPVWTFVAVCTYHVGEYEENSYVRLKGPIRGKSIPAERSALLISGECPASVSFPAYSKYTEKGVGPGKMNRLVSEASCLPMALLLAPKPVVCAWLGLKSALRISLNDWPPAAPPPQTTTRCAESAQPLTGSMPIRKPPIFGCP